MDDGFLPSKKTKCKNCKVVLHDTAACCSSVWTTPYTFSTFCTKDCIEAYNGSRGKEYPLKQHPPGCGGGQDERQQAEEEESSGGASGEEAEAAAAGASGEADAAPQAEELHKCGACNQERAGKFAHVCKYKGCHKPVHASIGGCDAVWVWMPNEGEGDYFCFIAGRNACAPSMRMWMWHRRRACL